MENQNDKLDILLDRLSSIIKRQESFSAEIDAIRKEIINIKMSTPYVVETIEDDLVPEISHALHPDKSIQESNPPLVNTPSEVIHHPLEQSADPQPNIVDAIFKKGINFEKLIGENLINKLGIAITIIGVAIGAKYSIDNNLINPLTRIILGYLMGIGLLGVGMKLKQNYNNFSAVLVSGAIAIMYFITYAAYSFYGLFSMEVAFGLMLMFTVFTVVTAIHYDKQVVAHIGLVGAYAVPFLLSEGSGKVGVLFTYMVIINLGILVLAFKKYWKALYYVSFALTWMIFASWYNMNFVHTQHFGLAFLFLTIFFAIFYAVFLAYKLVRKERFDAFDIIFLSTNSFIFYGFGYSLLSGDSAYNQLLGLFTLGNGLLHFIVTIVVYRMKLADRGLFYFVAGLVLVFITMAIPVQLDGHWVTMIWAFEAALLFWIGRTKNVPAYEYMSYPLMILSVASLGEDWSKYQFLDIEQVNTILPVFNIYFLTAVLVIFSFVFIFFIQQKYKNIEPLLGIKSWDQVLTIFLSLSLVMLIFTTVQIEIDAYWQRAYEASVVQDKTDPDNSYPVYNYDLLTFGNLWALYFSLIYAAILMWVNTKFVRNRVVGIILSLAAVWVLLSFLTVGLFNAGDLRTSYLNNFNSEFYERGIWHLGVKYLGIMLASFTFYSLFLHAKSTFMETTKRRWVLMELFVAIFMWVILSNELLTWMDINDVADSFKLGMSILWGIVALLYIVFGLWKGKKHIRIFAIVLFAITLLKLFFYDISHLGTIAKTIIFISLGILLLITSFLYNKYNNLTDVEEK
ncbi:MAG TPA: DUF2339 domain-containing protein [Saprospiraceae bacterium]|nr:DUF2339 domain-containing protein [Saprospiraceae bacterium]